MITRTFQQVPEELAQNPTIMIAFLTYAKDKVILCKNNIVMLVFPQLSVFSTPSAVSCAKKKEQPKKQKKKSSSLLRPCAERDGSSFWINPQILLLSAFKQFVLT